MATGYNYLLYSLTQLQVECFLNALKGAAALVDLTLQRLAVWTVEVILAVSLGHIAIVVVQMVISLLLLLWQVVVIGHILFALTHHGDALLLRVAAIAAMQRQGASTAPRTALQSASVQLQLR